MTRAKEVEETVPERNPERMHIRTKPHIKRAIKRAAELSGLYDTSFTRNAAYQAALDTIGRREKTVLSEADAEAFFEALLGLMKRHHQAASAR